MIRAVVFALVVAVASAAFIPVVDVDRSYPIRDEFDRPIYTLGDKAAFDVRTKTLRTEQDVPIVPAVAPYAAPITYAAAAPALAYAAPHYGYAGAAVRYI